MLGLHAWNHLARLVAAVAVVAVGMAFPLAIPSSADTQTSASCVIIDNDFDIDDFMAIPLVVGSKNVASIVQTEGYTVPAAAAPVADHLVNASGTKNGQFPIPVIVGASQTPSPELEEWPWMGFFRSMMNRGNGLLAAQPKPWKTDHNFSAEVAASVNHCEHVSILVLGPFTSFNQYLPKIRAKVNQVVVMGQPIGDESRTPGRESFNCAFDFPACQNAAPHLAKLNTAYVDIPRFPDCRDATNPPSHCYAPSFQMVAGLTSQGVAGRLRKGLINKITCSHFYTTPESQGHACNSLATWEPAAVALGPGGESLLWDQTAALFLVRPEYFSLYYPQDDPDMGGKHYEPTLVNGSHEQTVDRLRKLWTRYTNKAV